MLSGQASSDEGLPEMGLCLLSGFQLQNLHCVQGDNSQAQKTQHNHDQTRQPAQSFIIEVKTLRCQLKSYLWQLALPP